jgi:3-oxoacyl-[acyl-carrier protein] reductase
MKQRTALVTGASGAIGGAIAQRLAQAGDYVVLGYRSSHERAAEALQQIERAGGQGELCQFDVADGPAVRTALAELTARRTVDVLVLAAGVTRDAVLPSMSEEDWQLVTRTSLDGFFNVTKPLVMPMVEQRYGRIISIASISGILGNPGQTNYAAAKAGLIAATRSLALEVAKKKVTVNSIAPGLIDTDLVSDELRQRHKELIPMRRLGTPAEVAALTAFLASDEAAYITGQTVSISGGL